MFGYVVLDKPEIKFKDFAKYQSYYCGLCRTLKERYGLKGQITLNYDMTFLCILLSSLYEPNTKCGCERCIAHPFSRHATAINECSEYAADMNILLTYHKCLDDWHDDKSLKKRIYAGIIAKSAGKVEKKYSDKAKTIHTELDKLSELENNDSADIDEVSGCFGRLMSALFSYKNDEWSQYLSRLGFYLGKYIYILDAYIDYKEDIEKEHYNPLKYCNADKETVVEMLTMMMAECSKAYEMLPIVENKEILDNIIYAGVWTVLQTGKKNIGLENREGFEQDV